MSPALALTISLVLLVGNAFFVGAEFALISARRSVIEPRAEEGHWAARITLNSMENVSLMMAGAQLGITLCTLGLGALAEPAIAHGLEVPFHDLGIPESLVHPAALVVALFFVGGLHVVLGEMVPKNIALAGPDRSALALAPPMAAVVRVLKPVIWLLNKSANGVLRLVGVTPSDEVTSAFTRDEVAGLVEESQREGMLDDDETRLLTGALEFEERDASLRELRSYLSQHKIAHQQYLYDDSYLVVSYWDAEDNEARPRGGLREAHRAHRRLAEHRRRDARVVHRGRAIVEEALGHRAALGDDKHPFHLAEMGDRRGRHQERPGE